MEFVPIEKVLEPQVEVTALSDISGWITDDGVLGPKYLSTAETPKKIALQAGQKYYVDEKTARSWTAKGFVVPTEEFKQPMSDDEIADHRKDLTTVGLDASNVPPTEPPTVNGGDSG